MKKELVLWISFFLTAVLIVGAMSNFQFGVLDIQLYDTYYVLPWFLVLIIIVLFLGLMRALIKIIDMLTESRS